MAEKRNIEYDSDAVFISYSPEDIDWAEDELRPRLEKSGVKVITGEDLTGGATIALNRERAIADTRRTIVVLSPEWVANSWSGFEADMLIHLDPAAIKRKLLPVLLRKTEVPPRIARLTIRDLTDKKRYDSRLAQVIRDVEDTVPVPPAKDFTNRWEWYWRQARRRGITPARLAVVTLCFLALFLLFFTRGPGWERLVMPPNQDALQRLYAIEDMLFVASDTETGEDSGLWRSGDRGESWQSVGGFLYQGTIRAAVRDFAFAGGQLYAATQAGGLWRSGSLGDRWEAVGEEQLPRKLHRISASTDGTILLVSSVVEGVHLSSDGGDTWTRVDGRLSCSSDTSKNLPEPITEAAVLVSGESLFVGAGGFTRVHSGLYESSDGGLCWRMVHGQEIDGAGQMGSEYWALASVPGSDEVLMLYYNHDAEKTDKPTHLQTLRGTDPLWSSNTSALPRIVVVPGEPMRWYVAIAGGVLKSNTFPQSENGTMTFSPLRSCLVLWCDTVDFALDADGRTPLLLTWLGVYRWGQVNGYRMLWP